MKNYNYKRFTLIIVTVFTVFAIALLILRMNSYKDPNYAFDYFLNNKNLAEDQTIDPLILCGPNIIPVLLERTSDKAIPKRRYILLFLGQQEVHESIPLLKSIVLDQTEDDYIRGDALQAIYAINIAEAERVASTLQTNHDYLAKTAKAIMDNEFVLRPKRTYMQALFSIHE